MSFVPTIEGPVNTSDQDQCKWLAEALTAVGSKKVYILAAMKRGQTIKVLQYTSEMLAELKNPLLNPKPYYELFMNVFSQMEQVELYLTDVVMNEDEDVAALYATCQSCGNILPRMMLMTTVGVVYIKSKKAPALDILTDLMEMAKGVQNPVRGLFLRHYMSTMLKKLLPDEGNDYEGSVLDSTAFIVRNFQEMLWLWYRMETKSKIADKKKRDEERRQVQLLVGLNLVRLSDLRGLDEKLYGKRALPQIAEHICRYKEPLQQQYLFEVAVRVFPDEYHLATLAGFLGSLEGVCEGVAVESILTALMDRLGRFVNAVKSGIFDSGGKKEMKKMDKLMETFNTEIRGLTQKLGVNIFTPLAVTRVQCSLMELCLNVHPGEFERIDEILAQMYEYRKGLKKVDAEVEEICAKGLVRLIELVADPIAILDWQHFVPLHSLLNFQMRRNVALKLIEVTVKSASRIDSLERVGKLFDVIGPIVSGADDAPSDEVLYAGDIEGGIRKDQERVCQVLHIVDTSNISTLSKIYSGIRKQLAQGGEQRLRYTLKTMAVLYIKLALRCSALVAKEEEIPVKLDKVFGYIYSGDSKGILDYLSTNIPADEAISIFLHAANAADLCNLPEKVDEIFCAAFALYEENAARTETQVRMLTMIIASMRQLVSVPLDTYDMLTTKACQYSTKVPQKASQAELLIHCSNLFNRDVNLFESVDLQKKSLECLQKAVKVIDVCPPNQQFALYTLALNQYVNLYAQGLSKTKSVQALLDVNADIADSPEVDNYSAEYIESNTYFTNTVALIESRVASGEGEVSWGSLKIPTKYQGSYKPPKKSNKPVFNADDDDDQSSSKKDKKSKKEAQDEDPSPGKDKKDKKSKSEKAEDNGVKEKKDKKSKHADPEENDEDGSPEKDKKEKREKKSKKEKDGGDGDQSSPKEKKSKREKDAADDSSPKEKKEKSDKKEKKSKAEKADQE